MNKTVLLSFVFFVAIILSVECQTKCQNSSDCSEGECCGWAFHGQTVCTKMRAKGDICWYYGLRDVIKNEFKFLNK